MGKKIFYITAAIVVVYLTVCLLLYFFQESLLFNSKKLPSDYEFEFNFEYEDILIETEDNIKLSGVLCRADTSIGLVFFLHGSGGNIERYNENIPFYTSMGYDIFLLDYRGYGKSEGKMISEDQFHEDVRIAYKKMLTRYNEEDIVVIGFSLGGVPAAMLASYYNPKYLVLEGTTFSILEKGKKKLPFLPMSIISRYDFEIANFINDVSVPIAIFHGDKDDASDVSNALRLKPYLKPNDQLIVLKGEGHRDFAKNVQYITELKKLLQVN